jgi:iron uptake system component EfeO
MTGSLKNLPAVLLVTLVGCGPSSEALKQQVPVAMHDAMLGDLRALHQAAIDLQAAAPTRRGWNSRSDPAAVQTMRDAWVRARTAYEHTEGALAPIFSDLDAAIDERYDGFLGELNGQGDQNLFDDHGVTGMHGIERVLYSDVTPESVITIEKTLPGYAAAAFPATAEEADAFKNKLCAKLITDTQTLIDQWTPANIDLGGAYAGLVDLMKEQREKVNNASQGLEESRYSQRTMEDVRDNLAGTKTIYAVFQPWLLTLGSTGAGTPDGKDIDRRLTAGFAELQAAYDAVPGDAIPAAPQDWSAEQPTAADLSSDFGVLYTRVHTAVDPNEPTSIVSAMDDAGRLFGFPIGN